MLGSDSDSEVQFMGFERKVISGVKQEELENEGITYTGFNIHKTKSNSQDNRSSSNRKNRPRETIVISDDEDEVQEGPPRKARMQ